MKKIICLLIILATAGVANAAVIDIAITSLNGEPVPMTNEITVSPTDVVGLAITFDAPPTEFLYCLGVTVNVDGPAALHLYQIEFSPDFDPFNYCIYPPDLIFTALDMGIQGQGEPVQAVWNILIHCDDVGDVQVYLTDDPGHNTIVINEDLDELPYEYGPGVTIHQDGQEPACWLCPGQPYGDANGDGKVTTMDDLIMLRAWQTTSAVSPHGTGVGEYNCCADFNHDLKITALDHLIISQNWQASGLGTCSDLSCP